MSPNQDSYGFIFGPNGQKSLEILDRFFNPNTKAFLLKSGIKPGMKVLEIGCANGGMSCWLAEQLGNEGSVTAVDNHEHALMLSKARADSKKLTNLKFQRLSAYDLVTLNQKFDMVYARFVLHHLFHPTKVLQAIFNCLKPNGIYVAEEGITSSAFTIPNSEAWGTQRWQQRLAMDDLEGHERDPNYGMKLFYNMAKIGFKNTDMMLFQPTLFHQKDKELILKEMLEIQDLFVRAGGKLADWQYKVQELEKIVADETRGIAYYQSCQVTGYKPPKI